MSSEIDLSVGAISGHFRRLAIPAATGVVVSSLYNVVDNFFAGLHSVEGLAVLSLATTVIFLLTVVSFAMNAAIVALIGNALGAQKIAYAKRLASQGLSYAVFLSLVLAAVFLALAPLLVGAISTPGNLRESAIDYLNVAILSTPFFIVAFSANGILMTQGRTVPMLCAQIASCFVNIGLNPLFMFGIPGVIPGMGIIGIAVSTLVCQAGVMVFILKQTLNSQLMHEGGSTIYRPIRADFAGITKMALPIGIGYILIVIGIFIVQAYLKRFGPGAIAAFGIGFRLQQILLMAGVAMAAALRAIASRNFGARNYDRVREAFRFCIKTGVGFMLMAALLLWVGGRPAMVLFTDDTEVVRIGAEFLKVYGLLLPVHFLTFSMHSLLQAFKRPAITLCVNIYREILGMAIFPAILVIALGLDTLGVWLGVAASAVTACLLALLITMRVARKKIGGLFQAATTNQDGH